MKKEDIETMKEKCSNCGEEKQIVMRCHFCEDGYALCEDCAREHRSWCQTRDDWEFIDNYEK